MATDTAGIVLWRHGRDTIEILTVHPGGPFWENKDAHAWSIPKGEFDPSSEDSLAAARREFREELGHDAPDADYVELGMIRTGKKRLHLWLAQGDIDVTTIESNQFEIEWPPKSGRMQSFPEVDRAAWIGLGDAAAKLHKGQAPVVDVVIDSLGLESTS